MLSRHSNWIAVDWVIEMAGDFKIMQNHNFSLPVVLYKYGSWSVCLLNKALIWISGLGRGEGTVEWRRGGNFILNRLIICMYHIKEKGQGMSCGQKCIKNFGQFKTKRLRKRPEHKSEDNINMYLTDIYTGFLSLTITGSCEYTN